MENKGNKKTLGSLAAIVILAVCIFGLLSIKDLNTENKQTVQTDKPEIVTEETEALEIITEEETADTFMSATEEETEAFETVTEEETAFEAVTEEETAKAQTATAEYHFRNRKTLESHFEKHGNEFGGQYKTAEEYEAGASKVANSPDALHKLEAEDGDDVYYIEKTNEFVIVSKDGYIRTYFKPSAGIKYFNRQ